MPYDAFKTKDLYFVCGATNEKQWTILTRLLGLEHLREDSRFRTNGDRVEHREELFPLINEVFAQKTTDEWKEIFEGSGLPFAPINNMQRVFDHHQTHAREMIKQIPFEQAEGGLLKVIGRKVLFNDHSS